MKADFEKGTKICSRCRKELPLDMFGKSKNRSDGLNIYCKECSRIKWKQCYNSDVEHSRERARNDNDKRVNTFQRKGVARGNRGMLKRDYELTEEQLKRRNKSREYRKHRIKYRCTNAQGILIWNDGKLQDLESKEYCKIMHKEYTRQRECAIRGYVAKVTPSEHFLFDFDLEQMLKDNVYRKVGNKKRHITKWWKGEIRHWTVNDGIWKEG
jgi:hypothetical protein